MICTISSSNSELSTYSPRKLIGPRRPSNDSNAVGQSSSVANSSPIRCRLATICGEFTLVPVELPPAARALVESDALAHLVTLNADGSPQVSCVWVDVDDDEIVSGHLSDKQQKLRNVRRDPRVSLSIEGTEVQPPGMKQYVVVHGHARLEPGGAPELLQRLAHVYLRPDVKFPPMDDPPPGFVMRITPDRVGGVGPWAA